MIRIAHRRRAAAILLGIALLTAASVPAAETDRDDVQPLIPQQYVRDLAVARELRASGKYDEAIEALRAILAAQPNYYSALQNLGLCYFKKNDIESALNIFEKALSVRRDENLDDPHILNTVGWLYLQSGGFEKAEHFLSLAVANEEVNSSRVNRVLFNNIGLVYLYLGDLDQAEYFFQKAIEKYGNKGAGKNLELVREARQQLSENRRISAATTLMKEHVRWSILEGGAQVWHGDVLMSGEALKASVLERQPAGSLGHSTLSAAGPERVETATVDLVRDWESQAFAGGVAAQVAPWCATRANREAVRDLMKGGRSPGDIRHLFARFRREGDDRYLLNTLPDSRLMMLLENACPADAVP